MYNRAEVVDQNFKKFVLEGQLPSARTHLSLNDSSLTASELVELFESQVTSRLLDIRARELKNDNQCYYTIGSSGHEGNAAVGKAFRYTDMAFLHYRSGAFMVQRSKQLPGSTPIYDLLLSFTASSEEPIAGGRHKVFGSHPLYVPPQTSTISSHLPKAVGAALSIKRGKDLNVETHMPKDSVVLCTFGDASANHSTALGAINTAAWVSYQNIGLPLVFSCEDNGIGISVPTAPGWIKSNYSLKVGMKYISADGLHLIDAYEKSKMAAQFSRNTSKPSFLHMKTVRLLGHAGSDVELNYHDLSKIEETEFNDPLLHSARILIENNVLSNEEILNLYEQTRERIKKVSDYAVTRPKLTDPKDVSAAIESCVETKKAPPLPEEKTRIQVFDKEYKKMGTPQHMAKLINWGLTDLMIQYPNTLVFGEDVAKKGGVYHVTDNLYKKFGSKRVFNSPLDEQSIIGTGIGLAHNGFLPIPEIQFLAYVHNAEDQIRGEAATLAFFSQGQFTNPMVLRVAGLAYQKGFGGHFHNDNSLAVFRDIPGLIIAVPSRGDEAVTMMRTCVKAAHEQGRVVIFIEPIALYMAKDLHETGDKEWSFQYPQVDEVTPLGEMGIYGQGEELCIVTYGNGTYYSLQAKKVLEDKYNIKVKLIDLRWLAPLNKEALCQEVKSAKHILVVDECRKTGSLSEALVTSFVEGLEQIPKIKVLAADDCFIPLGPAAAAGLPKKQEVLNSALELLGVQP